MIKLQKKIENVLDKAKQLIDSGQFEAAASALENYWNGVGGRPAVESVPEPLKYELILLCGVLTGWLGSARQIEGSQETAKDLISEASDHFDELGLDGLWAESRGELALCYWREGAFGEARIILQDALDRLADDEFRIKAQLLLRLVNVEISTYNYQNADALLKQASRLIGRIDSPLLCGKVYFHHALVMRRLAEEDDRRELLDDSLKYYLISKKYYRKAGHLLYEAMVDNNLGYLLCEMREFGRSHEHLEKALKYFSAVKDNARISLVYDNKARVLLAENKTDEAERDASLAVSLIRQGDEQSSLAEYLTTLGHIRAVRGDHENAKKNLLEAYTAASRVGDTENGGLALLTLIEDFYETGNRDELNEYYLLAHDVLSRATQKSIINRLNRAARLLLQTEDNGKAVARRETSEKFFVGRSEAAKKILARAGLLAKDDRLIFISGESGTGKEALARQIHEWSGRAGDFTAVSCALFADPANELRLSPSQTELSATDFAPDESLIEHAAAGTLYLKDIEMLGAADQSGLIAFLEKARDKSGAHGINNRVCRLIVSSDVLLEESVADRLFREDLYYRLKTFEIKIPALRNRREDVRVIAEHLLNRFPPQTINAVGEEFFAELERNEFHGNGNELESFVENYVWSKNNGVKFEYPNREPLAKTFEMKTLAEWKSFSLTEELRNYEAEIISKALDSANGKVTAAAELLGITHQNLSALLKRRHTDLSAALKTRKKRTVSNSA